MICLARLCLPAALLLSGCSLQGQLRSVSSRSCPDTLARYPAVRGDPEYAGQPEDLRRQYESAVAECELATDHPEKALAIAQSFPEDWQSERLRLVAIAAASLKRDDLARESLEKFAARPPGEPRFNADFLVEWPEFRRYAGQDWYINLGLQGWGGHSKVSFAQLLPHLTGKRLNEFLKLSVARADRERPAGEWVFWMGKVKEARIDRSRNRTILVIEGANTDTVRTERTELAQVDVRPGFWAPTLVPKYNTTVDEEEVLELNGQEYEAEVSGTNEQIVSLGYVRVFGRYDGHDGERPTVKVLQIFSIRTYRHR